MSLLFNDFWVMSVVTSQCITFEQFPDVIIQRFCSDGCVMDWTKIMGRLLYTIYTHCLKLMNLVKSHGSSSLLFMMKVIVWHFVSDAHITALICVALVWFLLELTEKSPSKCCCWVALQSHVNVLTGFCYFIQYFHHLCFYISNATIYLSTSILVQVVPQSAHNCNMRLLGLPRICKFICKVCLKLCQLDQ